MDVPHDLLEHATRLFRSGQYEPAGNACLARLTAAPNDAAAMLLLGRVLLARGDTARATSCLARAVTRDPTAEAVDALGQALAEAGGDADTWVLHGNALAEQHRHAEALASFEAALSRDPTHADAINNAGAMLMLQRDHAAALQRFDAVPTDRNARWNAALARLALGDFRGGWAAHEARWAAGQVPRRQIESPPWLGESDLAGRRLLLVAEQGMGDTLQFCRYAALARDRGAEVILDVQSPLTRLLRRIPGIGAVLDQATDPLPAFDLHTPMMSLPLAFGTELASIPAEIPYLVTDPQARARWRERLASLPGRRIGLVWAGAPRPNQPSAARTNQRRSMRLADLADLAQLREVSWISLQKGEAAAEIPPWGLHLTDWTDELQDFADTADLVAELDLVISVDTSVAHLAGALGVPVWILSRHDACWRWLTDRVDSPWYPTALLFQQPAPGDWTSVVQALVAALG